MWWRIKFNNGVGVECGKANHEWRPLRRHRIRRHHHHHHCLLGIAYMGLSLSHLRRDFICMMFMAQLCLLYTISCRQTAGWRGISCFAYRFFALYTYSKDMYVYDKDNINRTIIVYVIPTFFAVAYPHIQFTLPFIGGCFFKAEGWVWAMQIFFYSLYGGYAKRATLLSTPNWRIVINQVLISNAESQ